MKTFLTSAAIILLSACGLVNLGEKVWQETSIRIYVRHAIFIKREKPIIPQIFDTSHMSKEELRFSSEYTALTSDREYDKAELPEGVIAFLSTIRTTKESGDCILTDTSIILGVEDEDGSKNLYVSNNKGCSDRNEIQYVRYDEALELLKLLEFKSPDA